MEALWIYLAMSVAFVGSSFAVGVPVSNSSDFNVVEYGVINALEDETSGNSNLSAGTSSWYEPFHVSYLWKSDDGSSSAPFNLANFTETNVTEAVTGVAWNTSPHLMNFITSNQSSSSVSIPWNTSFHGVSRLWRTDEEMSLPIFDVSNATANNQTAPESGGLTYLSSWDWSVELSNSTIPTFDNHRHQHWYFDDTNASNVFVAAFENGTERSVDNQTDSESTSFINVNYWIWNVAESDNSNASGKSSSGSEGDLNTRSFANVNSFDWSVEASNFSNSSVDSHHPHHWHFEVVDGFNDSATVSDNDTQGDTQSGHIHPYWHFDATEESNGSLGNITRENFGDNFFPHHLHFEVNEASNSSNETSVNEAFQEYDENQRNNTHRRSLFSVVGSNATTGNDSLPEASVDFFKTNLHVEPESSAINFPNFGLGSSQNVTSSNGVLVKSANESSSTGSFWGLGNTFKSFHPWVNWFVGVTSTEYPSEEVEGNETSTPANFRATRNVTAQNGTSNSVFLELIPDQNSTLELDGHVHGGNCDHVLDSADEAVSVVEEVDDSIDGEQRSSSIHYNSSVSSKRANFSDSMMSELIEKLELMGLGLEDANDKDFIDNRSQRALDLNATNFDINTGNSMNGPSPHSIEVTKNTTEETSTLTPVSESTEPVSGFSSKAVAEDTESASSKAVAEDTESASSKAVAEDTESASSKAVAEDTESASSKAVAEDTESASSKAVAEDTESASSKAVAEDTESASSKAVAEDTESASSKAVAEDTESASSKAVAEDTESASSTAVTEDTESASSLPATEDTESSTPVGLSKSVPFRETQVHWKPLIPSEKLEPPSFVYEPKPSKEKTSTFPSKVNGNGLDHGNQQPGMQASVFFKPLSIDYGQHSHSEGVKKHFEGNFNTEEQNREYYQDNQQPGMSPPVFEQPITRNVPALSEDCPTQYSGQPCPDWVTQRNPHCDSDHDCQARYPESICCLVKCRRRCIDNVHLSGHQYRILI